MKRNEKIDMVILWVNGDDPEWQSEKEKYSNETGDKSIRRFRDFDNLQYVFRGIEKYAKWVNTIYFITWGHVPTWLNTKHEKIKIIKHEDYIPKKYLPTFNSNVIELNLHRIKELSEQFVLLNDDTFLLKETKPEDFFINGKPTDVYAETVRYPECYYDVYFMMLFNVIATINKHFNKKECMKKNFFKYINFKYGKWNLKTLHNMKEKIFIGFENFHVPQSFLKDTFRIVWKEEESILDRACQNRFRESSDLGHFLCRYWQMVSGNFEPKKDKSAYFIYKDDNSQTINRLKKNKYKYVCINDAYDDIDFEKAKKEINAVLQELFPKKSSFEL